MLFRLFAENKAGEFASLALPEPFLQSLLELQYQARCAEYEKAFPRAEQHILLDESGEAAGHVLVDESATALRIVDLVIDGKRRGYGLGKAALRTLQARAQRQEKPIRLSVAADSPALVFYQRLGFAQIVQGAVYNEMVWQAEPRIEEPCA